MKKYKVEFSYIVYPYIKANSVDEAHELVKIKYDNNPPKANDMNVDIEEYKK